MKKLFYFLFAKPIIFRKNIIGKAPDGSDGLWGFWALIAGGWFFFTITEIINGFNIEGAIKSGVIILFVIPLIAKVWLCIYYSFNKIQEKNEWIGGVLLIIIFGLSIAFFTLVSTGNEDLIGGENIWYKDISFIQKSGQLIGVFILCFIAALIAVSIVSTIIVPIVYMIYKTHITNLQDTRKILVAEQEDILKGGWDKCVGSPIVEGNIPEDSDNREHVKKLMTYRLKESERYEKYIKRIDKILNLGKEKKVDDTD